MISFVMMDGITDTDQKSRGFAYVTYALKEDAVKAKSYIKVVSNRPVQIVFANKKSEPTPAAVKEGKNDPLTIRNTVMYV
jgi:hypothetical protein